MSLASAGAPSGARIILRTRYIIEVYCAPEGAPTNGIDYLMAWAAVRHCTIWCVGKMINGEKG